MSHRVGCGEKTPDNAFRSSFGVSFAVASQPQPEAASTAPPTVVEVPISYVVQTVAIPFDEKASRLELLVRIVWCFLTVLVSFVYSLAFGIIILVYSIVALILNIINFLVILITGKRWKTAFNWQAKLITKSVTYYTRLYNYGMRRAPYFGLMIDKRPDLGMEPEPTKTSGGSTA